MTPRQAPPTRESAVHFDRASGLLQVAAEHRGACGDLGYSGRVVGLEDDPGARVALRLPPHLPFCTVVASELLEAPRLPPGELLDIRRDLARLSLAIETLQVEKGVCGPLRYAGGEHGLLEVCWRQVHVVYLPARHSGDDPSDLLVRQCFAARECVRRAFACPSREHPHRGGGEVPHVDLAHGAVALSGVEGALSPDRIAVVRREVLHEAVCPKEGVGKLRLLDVLFRVPMEAREDG